MINAMIEANTYPCKHSRCEICKYYIKDRICWYNSYIPMYTWNGYDDPKEFNCNYFKSNITNQLNNHYIFRDYESMPIIKNGKYRFDSKGNRI